MNKEQIIISMAKDLIEMKTDTYQEVKLCLLAQTAKKKNLNNFVKKLFEYTDTQRPLAIGMKGI